ncbi:MAG TPA: tetratricopeptide repeat protein [Streptosporangiaceae bacterium]|nr:tetratricopeptide repeat protein [Streptosporangiaceae bacterium]
MLGESLLALAALAGQTVVDAATTDVWQTVEHRYAQLLGRGDTEQTHLVEQWLEETREQLAGLAGADMELIRTALAGRWAGRWADLLEENPAAEAELRARVQETQAALPAERRSVPHHAISPNGDVSTYAAGPEHPGALATRSELAHSVGQAGDAAAARDQFAALLPIAERVLGPEHPDTLINRHNLANFAGYAGDAAAARDQFAALVRVRERVFGADSPDTLMARFNLAYWTGRAGDAAAARDQFAALLPVRERIYGPDRSDTLATQKELAYWTGCAGDAAAARDQFAALLLSCEQVLGPEHPETLAVWYQLAHWTALAGDKAATQD